MSKRLSLAAPLLLSALTLAGGARAADPVIVGDFTDWDIDPSHTGGSWLDPDLDGTVWFTEQFSSIVAHLDPSTNVRLSALDALYPHANQPIVRSGVLATLPREQNPLVQVAMIDFLVAARDRAAVPELERLARSENINQAVRDAAQRGLAQL